MAARTRDAKPSKRVTPPLRLSQAEARAFLVRRHFLDAPRSLPASPDSVLQVVHTLGSLQFDPLETPGARNHELVLFARIARFDRRWLQDLLYAKAPDERLLFEAYNKSLNILPIGDLPFHRVAWERADARYRKSVLRPRRKSHGAILERIRAEGPLDAAAFRATHGRKIPWHWAETMEGRALLEALFESGRIGIATRDGNRRVFDLVDRLFPASVLARRVTAEEALRHRVLSRFRGVGLLAPGGAPEIMASTAPIAARRRVVAALVDEGVLVEVDVEGIGLDRAMRFVKSSKRTRSVRSPRTP